jgi:hypothetical protein
MNQSFPKQNIKGKYQARETVSSQSQQQTKTQKILGNC